MNARISDPAIQELTIDGQLLYRLEQRRPEDCSAVELAAIADALRRTATALEDHLGRPPEDVLAGTDVRIEVLDE